jgi:hypothetical protein
MWLWEVILNIGETMEEIKKGWKLFWSIFTENKTVGECIGWGLAFSTLFILSNIVWEILKLLCQLTYIVVSGLWGMVV